MSSLMMIQPGAFGDIILCAPIAKAYADEGYTIHWPVRDKFLPILERLPYVNPINLPDNFHATGDWMAHDVKLCLELAHHQKFDYVLNLADRGPGPTNELPEETFDETKYRLANLPLDLRHTLDWSRDALAEMAVYDAVVAAPGWAGDYIVAHLECEGSDAGKIDLPFTPDLPVVEVKRLDGYDIFDWYRVIRGAKEIYCLESSVQIFVDAIADELDAELFLLPRPSWVNGKAPWKQNLGPDRFGNTGSKVWNFKYMREDQ